jgi:hypothetical protein
MRKQYMMRDMLQTAAILCAISDICEENYGWMQPKDIHPWFRGHRVTIWRQLDHMVAQGLLDSIYEDGEHPPFGRKMYRPTTLLRELADLANPKRYNEDDFPF